MNNWRQKLSTARILFLVLALVGMSGLSYAQDQEIFFSATGDVPYGSSEVSKFKQQMANHNKYSPSAFFVHVGDILSGGSSCKESVYSQMAGMLKDLKVPAYIVPGDNETVDCKSPSSGMSYFLKYFKDFEQNFCAPSTERQSARPENWAFTMDGVLFIGVNLVYGGSSANKQAADWVKQQLEAKGAEVRAAAVFSHFAPNSSSSFSTPFRQAAAAFGKPVLFLHGHGHSWSTSYPFPEKNIFRVQVNKGGSEDPVQVTVTMNTSSPANAFILKRKPWSSKTLVETPPCANAGPAPDAPSDLITTLTDNSTITLAWTDNANDEDGFKIERKAGGGSFSPIATVGANVNAYNDAGLSGGNIYTYRVRAHRSNNIHSGYSNESFVTTPGSGGTSNSSNLALNQPVTASSTESDQPEINAVDGNTDTYWRSGIVSGSNPIAWLRVDLGAAMTVAQVNLTWKENYYAKTYEVQISNDEVNWTAVASGIGKTGTEVLSFTPTTARFARLYFMTNNKSNYRVIEFEVYSNPTSAAKRSAEAVAEPIIPSEFVLEQNYPNPFSANGIFNNPSTTISFGLPQASHVTIKVYNINGAEVETLVDAQHPAGMHTVVFNAENLSSGTYFYMLQAGEVRQVRRLMLVK